MLVHLLALNHGFMNGLMDPVPARYALRVNRHLGATILSAFPALAPHLHATDTVLTGLRDRSALYGVLLRLRRSVSTSSRCASSRQNANHRNRVTAPHLDSH